MSSLPKLSLFVLALGFLAAPVFANAAWSFPGATSGSSFQIPSLSNFSLKDIDARLYARLQKGGLTQTAWTWNNPWPKGFLDSVSNAVFIGWACDASNYATSITVHFYADGTLIGATTANISAEPAVAAECGGYASHRFSFTPPSSLKYGASHTINAYGINTPLGHNPELSGSPMVLYNPQCSDGIDNDGDSVADYPADPGCTSSSDTSERGTLVCDNGSDDDGDGEADDPNDPGCSSPSDTSEWGTVQCDDGVDNDSVPPQLSDGIDYKPGTFLGGDPDCDSPSDPLEGNPLAMSHPPCIPSSRNSCQFPQVNPLVNLTSNDVLGNAYDTRAPIYWNVKDVCDCGSDPGSWWNGIVNTTGSFSGDREVTIDTPGGDTYTLTCNKQPSCNASAGTVSDSVTITPQWNPTVSLLANPTSVNATQSVQLTLSATDIKTCTRSWTGGTLTLSGGNPQTVNINAGTISAPTTFTVNCIGFNDNSYQASAPVGFISGPTPYFSINSINLIIIGPGSGGRSNKAVVGVTKSGSFTGNIALTAAPASGSESLTSQGAELCLNATDGVTCSSSATILCTSSFSSTCDNTAEFWVETASNLNPIDYTITLTADPQPPSTLSSEKKTIPLRVRRFVPAFEEI